MATRQIASIFTSNALKNYRSSAPMYSTIAQGTETVEKNVQVGDFEPSKRAQKGREALLSFNAYNFIDTQYRSLNTSERKTIFEKQHARSTKGAIVFNEEKFDNMQYLDPKNEKRQTVEEKHGHLFLKKYQFTIRGSELRPGQKHTVSNMIQWS